MNYKIFKCLYRAIAVFAIVILLFTSGCQSKELNNGITKITIWHGINPPENRDVFNELVAKFNKTHQNIKVESLYIGQPDGQLPKILAAVVSNQPPDMLWFVPQLTGQLAEFETLLPLENWLNNFSLKQEIDPAMLPTMELNGHIFSIPFATNNTAIFYRPSLFKEAGITKLPETWKELQQTAQKLTKDTDEDGRIDRHGISLALGKGEFTVFCWLPFIFGANGQIMENDRPNIVNEGTITALQFGADLVKNNSAILSAPERGFELDNFLAGKVAMQITGPWTLGQLQQSKADYDVFSFPIKETKATVVGGENLFVFKTNFQQEQSSLKFLEYVLSEEFQTEWALKTGYLPINLKSQKSQEYQQFIQENIVVKVFLEQMKWARSRPITAKYNRLSENLGRAIEASLLGKQTPKQALQSSQQRLDLIFARE
jgi:multiple sugar transport system substrate-binding protein